MGGLGALSACGIPAVGKTQGGVSADDHSAKEKVVDFSNWPEYIDTDDSGKHRPTLDAFAKRTGIQVKYTEDINDNDEFFGKVQPQLAAGQATGRDLVVLTDWLAARMIRLGYVQKLDPSHLPHAFANLSDQFRAPDWDPGRAYSYPGRASRPSSRTTRRRSTASRSGRSPICSTTPSSRAVSAS